MATNDEKNMQDNNDMIKNNTLYPDAIIEEEIVETIFITDVDDDSDDNTDMTDSADSDYSTESMESVSGMDYIPDPAAGIDNENSSSARTDISATTAAGTDMADKDKKDEDKDNKKDTDKDNGDNDPIEDIDDQVVAETNELIKEKRAERRNNGCGC